MIVTPQVLLHAREGGWVALLALARKKRLDGAAAEDFLANEIQSGKWGGHAKLFLLARNKVLQTRAPVQVQCPLGSLVPAPVPGSARIMGWGFSTRAMPLPAELFSRDKVDALGLEGFRQRDSVVVSSPFIVDAYTGHSSFRGKPLIMVHSDHGGLSLKLGPCAVQPGDFLCCIARPTRPEDAIRDPLRTKETDTNECDEGIYVRTLSEWWRRPKGITDYANMGWLINDGNLSFPHVPNNCEFREIGHGSEVIVAVVATRCINPGAHIHVDYGHSYRL